MKSPTINKLLFDKSIKNVLQTPLLKYRMDSSVTIVSMVSSNTVNMYLVAIKSFMENFGYGTIEAINDGTLTASDILTLQKHIPNLNISDAIDIDTYNCPSYISWKRLFRIQKLAETSFVIQLDSDTISLGPLIEVHERVVKNEGFLIGSMRWGKSVDVNFLRDIVTQWNNTHVQPLAEANFHKMNFFADGTKYIRACAGFAGYPKDFASIEQIQALSNEIESYIGKAWHGWGSEQTATMCLISKTKNSTVLPWPFYQNFKFPTSTENIESMNFVHFIGSNRYDNGMYTKLSKKKIKQWL
jgi:hypothetical protein